ncbi:hypothetical protein PR001_g26642 [Phytophthora rubi]|uniref:Uncharacterized protein n=1 Tax=Phytophthora rubi TaxID=129364 RepID=A0A6A3HPA5_9STRA|nr:hypothetical protein PR001_g26642 [Phytophthora rubi]
MIITATVYIVEIQAIVQNDSTRTPQTTLDKLTILFELLEKKPKIHALICQADSTGL